MPPKNVKPAATSASGSGQQNSVIESTLTSDAVNAATSQLLNLDQQAPLGGTVEPNLDGSLLVPGTISTLTGSQVLPGTPDVELAAASELVQLGAEQSFSSDWLRPSIHGLAVKSSQDGFWRCGRQWTKAETRVALSEFSEDDVLRLIQEPMLTVVYIDLAEEESA